MAAERTQNSCLGSSPPKAPGTQTLPLQTQPPTQLLSHEVHQFTQLLDPDSVEHLHTGTMPNSSALEGPGSTLLVHDEDALSFRNTGGSLHDTDATARQSDLHPQLEARPHGSEDFATVNIPRVASSNEFVASDATTQEADIDGIGYLDSDAESRPNVSETNVAEAIGIEDKERHVGFVEGDLPRVGNGSADSLAAQKAPEVEVGVGVSDMKASQLEPTSGATRTVPSSAPGQLASDQSMSLGLSRKDGVKLDSDATIELVPCGSNIDPKRPIEALDGDLRPTEGPYDDTNKAAGSHDSEPGKNDHFDPNATLELDTIAIDNLPLVQGMPKTDINQTESHDQDSVANDTGLGANVKEDAPNAVSNALETACTNASEKPIQPPGGQELCSSSSGLRRASTSLSYLKSQEPGEETQIDAFNLVDKLVWLDTVCMADDIETTPPAQDSSIKDHAGVKGRQSLAQAAQMKTVRDKLDVFDWDDSQPDNIDTQQDTRKVSNNVRSRKRKSEMSKPLIGRKKQEAYKPMTARKKQISADHKKTEITTKENDTLNVGKAQMPSEETPFVTTRLRDGPKAHPKPPTRGKQRPRRGLKKEEKSHEPIQGLKAVPQKDTDNAKGEEQQAGVPCVHREVRKQAGRKKSVDESDKDAQVEQPKGGDSIRRTLLRGDSGAGKGKKSRLKASKGAPDVQGKLDPVANRTSQDDAMADMWIDAFASKPPPGSVTEIVKFRKRSALHEDTGLDSKKRRTPTLLVDEEHQDSLGKEEDLLKENRNESDSHLQKEFEISEDTDAMKSSPHKSRKVCPPSLKEHRIKPKAHIQQTFKKSEDTDAAKKFPRKGRKVSTRLSQEEKQAIDENASNKEVHQLITMPADMQLEKKKVPTRRRGEGEHTDVSKGEKVTTRRRGEGEHTDVYKVEEVLMKKDMAEEGLKGRKKHRSADVVISPPVTSKGHTKLGRDAEHVEFIDGKLERGPKTRSKAQDAQVLCAGSDTRKSKGAEDAFLKSSTTEATTNDTDVHSLSIAEKRNDIEVEKAGIKTSSSKKRQSLLSHQQSMTKPNQNAQGNEGTTVGFKTRKRIRDADIIAPKSAKAGRNSTSQHKEDGDKTMQKMDELDDSKKNDELSIIAGGRSRRSTYDGGSQKNKSVSRKRDKAQSHGGDSVTIEQTQKNHRIADKGSEKEVLTGSPKSLPRRTKKISDLMMSEMLSMPNVGRRRKTEPGCIRVLFSHSLMEDVIKHQKKILAKLGGKVVTSAPDCTHFVSNNFVRTQNMLMSMAAGKVITTPQWLESCGQAHYFVDAKKYILQDAKKEREFGFSMTTSIAAAEHTPLLKGKKMLVCPNTVPEPAVLQSIVESAGGQAMDLKSYSSLEDSKDIDASLIIIGNKKDFDFCAQFLEKGLKVYSEELLLQGIITQTLDFSRNRLFEDSKQRSGLRQLRSIKA